MGGENQNNQTTQPSANTYTPTNNNTQTGSTNTSYNGYMNNDYSESNSTQNQQPQQGYRMQGSSLPNFDINSMLGLNNNSNGVIPQHLGHHGGHHLVSHLMGQQYSMGQTVQPLPAYVGPTHSVLPSLPMMAGHQQQPQQPPPQQYSNQYMNTQQQQPMMNQQMMHPPPQQQPMMRNMNDNAGEELETYSQDVLLLVVEQQRRIYHLEEELQKAQEYINKLQDYAKNLEVDKEKHAKKQSRYWTQQEHQKFLQGIDKYGRKDVKAIANFVGSRNATQVRTHAQKYYAKLDRDQRRMVDGKRGSTSNSSGDSDDDIIDDEAGGNSNPEMLNDFQFPKKSETRVEDNANGHEPIPQSI
jgi:SHAQKYF class myb-like DNA-binding protein